MITDNLATCGTLVNSEQPAFEQRRDSMDTGHGDMGRISAIREVDIDVRITMLRHTVITAPGIFENC